MIYATRSSGREHGTVMTNHEVVEFMLDVSGYCKDINLSNTTILEPSVGHGAFLLPILERLFFSSQEFNFSFEDSIKNILAVDIDEDKVSFLQEKVSSFLLEKGIKEDREYAQKIVKKRDFLLSDFNTFDIIIGNPPYVRHELIPEDKKLIYRKLFHSFRHRSDLYIAFFEKSLSLLKESGKMNFICADRWMKNKYGERLRELIKQSFHISLIVDIDSEEVFDEQVDAYPAITLIEKTNKSGYMREKLMHIENLSDIRHSFLSEQNAKHSFSFINSNEQENLYLIEEEGFKIGIGVASGADSVFIGKNRDFDNMEDSLLLPIIKSKDIVDGEIKEVEHKILNPFCKITGGLIDLEKYPHAKNYLEAHKEKLSSRHVAKRNPGNWYKTIDRIYPNLKETPKLLIPDIKKNSNSIVLDRGEYYPHHNIYYISHAKNSALCLEVLGAFLLSDFVHEQMKNVSVLMRGGHFRWQAQNLRKLKIPSLQDISQSQMILISSAFKARNVNAINHIVDEIIKESKQFTPVSKRNVVLKNEIQSLPLFEFAS